jgi:hypothetical protein
VEETLALRLRCKPWSNIWGGIGSLTHRSGDFMSSQLRRTIVLLHFANDPKDRKVEDITVYTHFLLACSVADPNFWGWGVHPTAPSPKSHGRWILLHFAFWTMNRINKRTAFKRVPTSNFGGYAGCETPSLRLNSLYRSFRQSGLGKGPDRWVACEYGCFEVYAEE